MNEFEEQVKVVKYLDILQAQGKVLFYFAVINEQKRVKNSLNQMLIGKKLKQQGKKAGVSDLVVILKDKVLFITHDHKLADICMRTQIEKIKIDLH